MARKKLSDAQKQFIAGDDINTESSQQILAEANTQVSTEISDRIGANLKQELFGDRKSKESSIRFTVDIPESLNKRLAQLSVDTSKPKTELVRTIIESSIKQS